MIFKDFNEIPKNHYRTVLVDVPWEYENKNTGGGNESGASQKYSVMNLKDVFNLPVKDICMEDAILFFWATTPLLPEAIEVIKKWGFQYKTTVYWNKMSYGMGFWFRGQMEMCLLAIKGNIKPFRCQNINLINSKAREHSQKPEEIFWLIEQEVAKTTEIEPKIELFARTPRNGWDSFGNELQEAKKNNWW